MIALGMFFFISGGVGLAYELLWLRKLALLLGSTADASALLLACFMGGLGLGSFLFGRRAEATRKPLRWYGALELALAGYCAASPLILEAVEGLGPLPGRAYSPLGGTVVGALAGLAALGPPAVLMGGTLPMLLRSAELCWVGGRGRAAAGWLYGINTLGAVAGTLLCAFWMVESFGVNASLRLGAALQALAAAGALALSLSGEPPAGHGAASPESRAARPEAVNRRRETVVLLATAATGAASMAYELGWTRLLVLTVGSSVYAFALILAATLAGIGAGGLACGWRRAKGSPAATLLPLALAGAGLSALALLPAFGVLPVAFLWLLDLAQANFRSMVAAGAALSLAAVFIPAFFLGLALPASIEVIRSEGLGAGASSGRVYAASASGSAAGALLAGLALIPLLGTRGALILAAWVNLLCAAWLWKPPRQGRRLRLAGAVAGLALLLTIAPPRWDLRVMASGVYRYADRFSGTVRREGLGAWVALARRDPILFSAEGRHGWVLVRETPEGRRYLSINGKVDASAGPGSDQATELLAGHLPLLLAGRAPRRCLVVGLGSGVSLAAVLAHPVESVDVVEIEPAVALASRQFEAVNRRALDDPRTRLVVDDARRFLAGSPERYALIASEPSNPWISGVSNLFTEEFYRLVRARLEPGGAFCQWLNPTELSQVEYGSAIAALLRVFPEATLWKGGWALSRYDTGDTLVVAWNGPAAVDLQAAAAAMGRGAVNRDLHPLGLAGPLDLARLFLMGPRGLRRLSEGSRPNTDDKPSLEFGAPRGLFQGHASTTLAIRRFRESLWSYARAAHPGARVPAALGRARDLLGQDRVPEAAALVRGLGGGPRMEALRRKLSRSAGVAEGLAHLGRVYQELGMAEDASELFTEAIERDPGILEALVQGKRDDKPARR